MFSEFQNIVELEEWQWPTAINRPAEPQAQFKVYGEAGTLHVVADGNGAASVNVFGIDGASVWSGQVTGRLEISLPKGFNMVRVGKTIRKVSL